MNYTDELKDTIEGLEREQKSDQPSGMRDLSNLDAEIIFHVAHGLSVWDRSFVNWKESLNT